MITCVIRDDKEMIPCTARYFAAAAVSWGCSAKRENNICLILESALEKRVDQLNEANPDLTVRFSARGRKAIISITDLGVPYIPSSSQKSLLSRGMVDGFKFEQLGPDGQRISFFFDMDRSVSKKEDEVPQAETLQDENISCRLITESNHDILEAIRSIYSVWNFNYVHEEIYRIKEYRNLLCSGKYISAMAENEHGQVLGHVAMEEHEWFEGLPEVCGLTVRPLGQGMHISDRLMQFILETAGQKKLNGLYGMPVTNHAKSQAGVIKLGFTPCGLYRHFTATGNTDPFADSGHRTQEGITVNAFAVKMIEKDREHALYLPDECIPFVSGIFDELDVKYKLLKPSGAAEGKPKISYDHSPINRSLGVRIDTLGEDLEKNFDWLRSQVGNGPVETVTVYVNMNDPTCPACYEYLRKKGFVFTGCLPGSSNGDYLILLDLFNTPIDKDKLDLHPKFKEMVDKLL